MTAEVIILNKSAVALAADSAVTIGDGSDAKIYNSVNKLFTLSKTHPVGIMIYANADYMGIPFETIVKTYRQTLSEKPQAKVVDYATAFLDHLKGDRFRSETQQKLNVSRIWQTVFEQIVSDIRAGIRQKVFSEGECPANQQKQIIKDISERHLTRLEAADVAKGFEEKKSSTIVTLYEPQFGSVIGVMPLGQNQTIQRMWKKIAGMAITKSNTYQTYSGVVVTGFGEDEVFPQYVSMHVSGVVADIPKNHIDEADGIELDGGQSMIVPFAQSEMVGRFMDGVDRAYSRYIKGAALVALAEVAGAIIDVHVQGTPEEKSNIKDQVFDAIGTETEELFKTAAAWQRQQFADPVLDALVYLPKDDLANLAEALVNLTSIKRRVSTERETVGGPIDVAVISKGDGFIWIKRKHYFNTELNPHFVVNYRNAIPKEVPNG